MGKLKKFIKKTLWTAGEIIESPATIDKWYGRLGNNIQQIAIAIMYAQKNERRVTTPDHPLIHPISYGRKNFSINIFTLRNRFFFFSEEKNPSTDVALNYEYVCENIQKVAKEFIAPNLKIHVGEPLEQDVLVIHLRGGDVFDTNKSIQPNYVQNPLSFYEKLINKFNKTIVIHEPGIENPIASILKNHPSVTIKSSSIGADFQTLLRARNIATSGVGTFAIAAALCSKNLVNLFCTDRYLREHLNPEMVKEANVHCLHIGDEYMRIGEWDGGQDNIDRMLKYQVNEEFFINLFDEKL